ncbi:hypothetical protein DAEQUDRAFT_731503 [Daedalea quercina L-15889]|uniref:N-acetyltransferase domain-containing protein n=1 Tax=Daedalea quercina L-15889 TaxID=1314783 RepID=A0A165M861_9APHY|nr:hypothetical protein DAEQUDRAFT_731503 [Daedalea quercina L-15889]
MPPSNITIKKIDSPTEVDVADATAIFCKLMLDDPFFVALTGGQSHLLPVLVRGLIGDIAFKAGDMYGALDEHGVMVGFQAWTPPGNSQLATAEDKIRLRDFFLALPSDESRAYVSQTIGVEFPKLQDVLSGIPQCELTTHWCNFNFVKEEYHKQGISKALMDLAVQKSRENGWTKMGLATTNARNVPIYERLGFVNEGYKLMKTPINRCPVWIFIRTLD